MTDADDRRYGAQLHLRLAASDAVIIRERAGAAGLSISAYVRRASLAGGAPAAAADVRELRPLYAELRRCGNNVNQIARALNSYGPCGAGDAAVAASLASLERACGAIAAAMEAARP